MSLVQHPPMLNNASLNTLPEPIYRELADLLLILTSQRRSPAAKPTRRTCMAASGCLSRRLNLSFIGVWVPRFFLSTSFHLTNIDNILQHHQQPAHQERHKTCEPTELVSRLSHPQILSRDWELTDQQPQGCRTKSGSPSRPMSSTSDLLPT